MSDAATQEQPTSLATTPQTEPAVLAAISSGEGQPTKEQAIRERAYALWEEEGRPDGKDLDHWHRAEAEIRSTEREEGLPTPKKPIQQPREVFRGESVHDDRK
jgi:hypothetical protein